MMHPNVSLKSINPTCRAEAPKLVVRLQTKAKEGHAAIVFEEFHMPPV